jgi:hypothetical protein
MENYDPGLHGEPLTPQEASERLAQRHKIFLGVHRLADLRSFGGGPTFYKMSHRAVRYPMTLLDAWADVKNRQPLRNVAPLAPSERAQSIQATAAFNLQG